METAKQQAKRILGEVLEMDAASIPDTASMETMPQWDSLNHIRLISLLEKEFGRPIEGPEILAITSLMNLASMLRRRSRQ